ncbi:MAG: XapX domain-containing protein [Roseovarius sp.]|uniref:XapX domain-containing protein n=1 Tax=Roseovarius sp. TaxID=1486281 RepID=UPI001B77BAE8|nr:XapX domain-containing protein [Roseovarius sp.]MBQ0750969.1 XapX domain-containing protein [Roseovarius sp.]MBQ0810913.1 XapX domain-containing protein [Roseovarius sp.]
MKIYLLSLGAGLLVGAIYSFLNIRSPAPPVIALVGLFGILIGEQTMPLLRQVMAGHGVTLSWFNQQCRPHLFGHLPQCGDRAIKTATPSSESAG